MRKTTVIKWICLTIGFMLLLCFSIVYGVYHGIIPLNNPSVKRYPIRGIDVSHYQGEIDWEILSGEGIQFAYIKASEGSSHVDQQFSQNWQQARMTNLKVGAYHFFSFDSPGQTQAEHFIEVVGSDIVGMLPPVVDVEFYGDKKQNPPSAETVYLQLHQFLDTTTQYYGVKPVIYATMDSWELYIQGEFDDYPLWIRDVYKQPVLGNGVTWTIWQYSNRRILKGYQGAEKFIDMNAFYGNHEQWDQFLKN